LQKFRKKIARLRFFTTRSGPSLALILALGACKPVQEVEVPTPAAEAKLATLCGDAGQLRTELYGAVSAHIDWSAS